MTDISISVVALAVVVLGLVGLVVAASKRNQDISMPAGIKVRLDADSATPFMRALIAVVSIVLIGFGGYLILVIAEVIPKT